MWLNSAHTPAHREMVWFCRPVHTTVELIPCLAFSDVSGTCLSTPAWSGTPSPLSPSVSSITDDVANYHIEEPHAESLLWAQPATPSSSRPFIPQGPLWCDVNTAIVPEIVITPFPSSDVSQEPHKEIYSEDPNFLLSPAGLFTDLFDDTIPPSSALYELSDDQMSALFSVPLPVKEAPRDQHASLNDYSQDSSSSRASAVPPTPSPSVLVQRTRRAKSNSTPPTRYSPYRYPLALPSSSLSKKNPHPNSASPATPLRLYPIEAGPANPEVVPNDMAKETVGTDAVVEASTRRRKRPARFRCDTCFEGPNQLERTFTSAHNLKSKSTSFLCHRMLTVCSHPDHLNSHLGKKDHQCGWCEKSFVNRHDLTRHTRKLHGGYPQ